jgi:hypothetical protein
MLITALAGLVVVFGQYFQAGQNLNTLTTFNTWFQIGTTVAYPIGLVSLTIVHLHNIQRKRQDWWMSAILIVATYVYLIVSLFSGPKTGTPMNWVYQGYISPASATLYGMIAFIITSATFRVFRFRSREAIVLIAVAMFILLAQAPLGDAIWSGWDHVGTWIELVPGNAAYRAITLGAYLGAFATAIRILLGIERAHIGGLGK